MLQVTAHHSILLAVESIDFRKGIDGLIGVCRRILERDPFEGTWFIFTNRRKTAIKCLVYDGQGFWLCLKRLSSGRLKHWPSKKTLSLDLSASELIALLNNGDPDGVKPSKPWREVKKT